MVLLVAGIVWPLRTVGGGSEPEALLGTAVALLVAAPAVVVVGSLVRWREPVRPDAVLGAAVMLGGALFLALGWRARARLSVSVTGDDSVTADTLRSLVRGLGSSRPRGLEVPIGSEATFLEDVGVTQLASGTIAVLLTRVATLARPVDPWQLTVIAHSADRLTVELTRNRDVIRSEIIERHRHLSFLETDGEPTENDPPAVPDLAPFAAAIALVEMATGHGQTEGLGGATRWNSVGLQYLGSLQPRRSPSRLALFAHALDVDGQNRAAQLSFWHALFRDSSQAADLQTYRDLLEAFVSDRDQTDALLRLRALYTRVVVGINLVSLQASDPTLRLHTRALLELAATLARSADSERSAFATYLLGHAQALARSVTTSAGSRPTEVPRTIGPGLAYSLACYWGSPEVLGSAGALRDPERALTHLGVANLDPELDRWRSEDPQLARLRETPTYRATFGRAPETDVLAVAPFSDAKKALSAAGLSSIARLASVPRTWLMDLGVTEPTARWMIQLAQMASRLPPGLEAWRVPIVKMLADDGLTELPSDRASRKCWSSGSARQPRSTRRVQTNGCSSRG